MPVRMRPSSEASSSRRLAIGMFLLLISMVVLRASGSRSRYISSVSRSILAPAARAPRSQLYGVLIADARLVVRGMCVGVAAAVAAPGCVLDGARAWVWVVFMVLGLLGQAVGFEAVVKASGHDPGF